MDEDNILEKELQRSFDLRLTDKNLGMRLQDGVMVLDFAQDERLPQPVAQAMQTAEQYRQFYEEPGAAFVPTGEGLPAAGRAVVGGVRDAAQGFLDMTGELGELAEGVLPMGYITFDEQGLQFKTERPEGMQKIELPEVPKGDSVVENLSRGFIQFAAGMAAAPVRGLGYGAMIARSGFADALFDPEQGNLSTAINELGLGNEVTELLDSKVGEDADAAERLKARLLQAGEGGIIGAAADAGIAAIRAARGDPELKETIKRGLRPVQEYAAGAEKRMAERSAARSTTLGAGIDPQEITDPILARTFTQNVERPGRISTRLPTAKAATEDPMTGNLVVGLEEMKADPKLYEFNVNITKDYPNMRVQEGTTVDQTAEQFIEHVKDNLLYVHDQVPEQTRQRSKLWYDGARNITDRWKDEYGVPDTSVAGALAALSPQKDWYQNVSLAERVLDVARKKNTFTFTPEMESTFRQLPSLNKPKYEPLLDLIRGKTYDTIKDEDPDVEATLKAMFVRLYDQTYNPADYRIVGPEGDFLDVATSATGAPKRVAWGSLNEIGKAVASIEAQGDVNKISRLMGERHKVRNFYNNIYDPNSPMGDVTIDTHAVAAGLMRPLSGNSLEVDHNFKNMSVKGRGTTKGSAKTGVSGNYGLYAEAYRRAAQERGILPREMQSITWEAVRGLFTDKFKQSSKNVAEVDAIWQRYKNGEIEIDEARKLVNERAGGIAPPTWE